MAYQDLLFAVLSYPDPTPETAVHAGAALAKCLGRRVTGLALEVDISTIHNQLASAAIGLADLTEEEARSAAQAQTSLQHFTSAASKTGLLTTTIIERAPLHLESKRVCEHARTHDLCLLAIGPKVQADRSLAEAVLFNSGRPIVVFPEDSVVGEADHFTTVAVAWDGGRAAARAVADALPILREADQVRILVVTDEKPGVGAGTAQDLVRHLETHDVRAIVDEVPGAHEPISLPLSAYVSNQKIELLVMGGFGHTRLQEFILGGATSSVLEKPPCPVLLSH